MGYRVGVWRYTFAVGVRVGRLFGGRVMVVGLVCFAAVGLGVGIACFGDFSRGSSLGLVWVDR